MENNSDNTKPAPPAAPPQPESLDNSESSPNFIKGAWAGKASLWKIFWIPPVVEYIL